MSHVSIQITDGDRNPVGPSAYARNMATALNDAIADAKQRVQPGKTLYLRDCLGGLRAEVRRNSIGDKITIVRT